MDSNRGLYWGLLAAPLLPSAALSAMSPGLGVDNAASLFVWTWLLYLPSAVVTSLFALPSFLLLQRGGILRWWSAALCGAAGGSLACSAFTGFRSPGHDLHGLLTWCALGAATAFVVWVFWNQQRHATPRNRSLAKSP